MSFNNFDALDFTSNKGIGNVSAESENGFSFLFVVNTFLVFVFWGESIFHDWISEVENRFLQFYTSGRNAFHGGEMFDGSKL